MYRRTFPLALTICLLATAHTAHAIMIDLKATLSGDQEVPPVMTDAFGSMTGVLTGDFGMNNFVLQYEIDYADLSSPIAPVAVTGAHVHVAPLGSNGGIVHLLDTNVVGTTSGTIVGDWRFDDAVNPLTEALVQEVIAGNTYVNLHTDNFGGGEIRGQIFVPEPGTILLVGLGLFGLGARARKSSD